MKTMKLILIAVCLLTCAGCQHNMVPLEADLPPVEGGRAHKPRQKLIESFLVPRGTKLLSRGVEVTSSYKEPFIGELEYVTDGDKDDWIDFVELGPGLQWVQLDLGKSHALHAILVWHSYFPYGYYGEYSGHRRVYEDVVVQISNDPAFKNDVKTVFNNDHDNSSGLGRGKDGTYLETSEGLWVDPKGLEGRYVRLYSRGHKRGHKHDDSMTKVDSNQYIEVEVYGKSVRDQKEERELHNN
jgi:hypothetical protein